MNPDAIDDLVERLSREISGSDFRDAMSALGVVTTELLMCLSPIERDIWARTWTEHLHECLAEPS